MLSVSPVVLTLLDFVLAPALPPTPAWEWAAAAFAGAEAVTIDGVVHAITGTPQVWMP